LVPFKYAQLIGVAKIWKTLDVMKIKLWAVTLSDVQFRDLGQVAQLESGYLTRSINRDFNQLPLENYKLHYILYLRGKNGVWVDKRQFC
jgi:hypothetical protein